MLRRWKSWGNLVRLFGEKFEEQKRAQNIIDFSDMEQYALRILTEKIRRWVCTIKNSARISEAVS